MVEGKNSLCPHLHTEARGWKRTEKRQSLREQERHFTVRTNAHFGVVSPFPILAQTFKKTRGNNRKRRLWAKSECSAIRWSSIWDPAVLLARTTSSKPQLPCLYYVSQKASRYSAGMRVKWGLKYLSPVAGRWEAPRENGHHQHLILSWSFLHIPHSHPFSTREALTFVY